MLVQLMWTFLMLRAFLECLIIYCKYWGKPGSQSTSLLSRSIRFCYFPNHSMLRWWYENHCNASQNLSRFLPIAKKTQKHIIIMVNVVWWCVINSRVGLNVVLSWIMRKTYDYLLFSSSSRVVVFIGEIRFLYYRNIYRHYIYMDTNSIDILHLNELKFTSAINKAMSLSPISISLLPQYGILCLSLIFNW